MENKKLSADQLNKLKETVRQRFDELYQRIGTNRQNLATKVLQVDHAIIREFAKETIDTAHEMEILRRVREIERVANAQLPHFHKVTPVQPSAPKLEDSTKPKVVKESKPAKPAKESKPTKTAKKSQPVKGKKK